MLSYLRYPSQTLCDACKPRTNIGYAAARFNEIAGKHLLSDLGTAPGIDPLTVSHDPVIGGCMIWESYGGQMFAAIVERVWRERGRRIIITSERHGKQAAMGYVQRNDNRRGSWGMGSDWTYKGCIVNPACTIDRDDIPSDPVRFGQHGDAVTVLQYLLCLHGFDVEIDGYFGAHTRNELGKYQRDNGLTVDHVCAGETLERLVYGVYII